MKDSTLNKYKRVIDEWFLLGRKPGDGAIAYMNIYGSKEEESSRVRFQSILQIVTVGEYVDKRHEEVQQLMEREFFAGIGDVLKTLHPMAFYAKRNWEGLPIAIETREQLKAMDMLIRVTFGYAAEKHKHDHNHSGTIKLIVEKTYEAIEEADEGHRPTGG